MTSHVMAQAPALGPLPDAVGGVQLVACIGPSSEVTLEVCNYTEGGSWTRMGYTRDVSIYAVQSGQQLDRAHLRRLRTGCLSG